MLEQTQPLNNSETSSCVGCGAVTQQCKPQFLVCLKDTNRETVSTASRQRRRNSDMLQAGLIACCQLTDVLCQDGGR
jgi:hypothetical protein